MLDKVYSNQPWASAIWAKKNLPLIHSHEDDTSTGRKNLDADAICWGVHALEARVLVPVAILTPIQPKTKGRNQQNTEK